MPAWDIDPICVQATLSTTGDAGGELEMAATSLVNHVSGAAESAGTAVPGDSFNGPMAGPVAAGTPRVPVGPVAAALSTYLTERQKKIVFVALRTVGSMKGAATATNEYLKGDLEMAERAQKTALKETKVPDMPGANAGQGPK